MSTNVRRIIAALVALWVTIVLGGLAFRLLGHGQWSFADSIYFAIITVFTVGYAELPNLERVGGARLINAVLILIGSATLVLFQSSIIAALVEGSLGNIFRRKRMRNQIRAVSNHVVVAGIGSTGKHVIEELWAIGQPLVAIDRDLSQLEATSAELTGGKMLFVHGDATADHVLLDAGVNRASGVVAALTTDRENLYVTLSARSLNPTARIVARVVEPEATKKMLIAGANSTVSPNMIGGQRMAAELVRPEVLVFLDQMMRDKDKILRLEEAVIRPGCRFAGQLLRDVPFRSEANVLVVAVRDQSGTSVYNPGPDYQLREGTVLIVLGEHSGVQRLRELMGYQGLLRPDSVSPSSQR